jgi:hypothetical protein
MKACLPFIVKRDARTHAHLFLTSLDPKISLSNIALSWIEYKAQLHAAIAHANVPLLLSSLKSSASCAFTQLLPQIECVGILYLLPHRHHDFHLGRVDRWLESNASCLLFHAPVDPMTPTHASSSGVEMPLLLQRGAATTSSPLLPQILSVGVSGAHEDPAVRWGSVARTRIRW